MRSLEFRRAALCEFQIRQLTLALFYSVVQKDSLEHLVPLYSHDNIIIFLFAHINMLFCTYEINLD